MSKEVLINYDNINRKEFPFEYLINSNKHEDHGNPAIYYMTGDCHTFAIALAECLNIEKPSFLVLLEKVEDDFKDEYELEPVFHVFLYINNNIYDVRGKFNKNNVLKGFKENIREYLIIKIMNQNELFKYISSGPCDIKPLGEISYKEMEIAKEIILRTNYIKKVNLK